MTVVRMLGRLTASLILTLSLTSLAFANDRADAGRTETGVSMVPSVHAPPAQVGPLTDTATLGGAVPWATIAPPPAWGAPGGSGATLVQGGGGGTPQLRYYALDGLGSVRVVFDAAGAVVSRADYEPFGAAVATSTTGTLPRQQFTGQERDGEVGVDYFGARLYVPQHGRMPSVDPLYVGAVAEPQRWNRYAYALNAPLHLVDPDGRQARSCSYHVGVVWFDGYWFDTGYFSMSCSNSNPRGGIYDSGADLPSLGSGGGESGTTSGTTNGEEVQELKVVAPDVKTTTATVEGLQEALKRLEKPRCSGALDGPERSAASALLSAEWRVIPRGGPINGEVNGAAIASKHPYVDRVLINADGPFFNLQLHENGKGFRFFGVAPGISLLHNQAAIVLHETGHLTNVHPSDAGNNALTTRNTQNVLRNCFP